MVTYKDLKLNDNNPRTINSDSFKQLKKSVKGFLKFLEERPILYDENKVIWAGNQRYRALSSLIKAGEVEDNPKYYKELIGYTELEKQQAAILDNSPEGLSGRWDFDMLANKWSDLPLNDWGINVPDWDVGDGSNQNTQENIDNKYRDFMTIVVVAYEKISDQDKITELYGLKKIPMTNEMRDKLNSERGVYVFE